MLSRLEKLLDTRFQPAASTDTRQAIRHPPNDEQPQKRDKHNKADSALWKDSAGLSIDGLIKMLEDFLQAPSDAPALEEAKEETKTAPAAEDTEQKPSPPTARAAQAYQNTATRTAPYQSGGFAQKGGESKALKLSPQEKETIKQLVSDLKSLQSQGHEMLAIETGTSPLETIQNSVKKALSLT